MEKYKIAKTLLTFETPLSPDIKSMSCFVNRYAVFAVSVASVLCMAAGVSAAQDGNRVSPLQQPPSSLHRPPQTLIANMMLTVKGVGNRNTFHRILSSVTLDAVPA